MTLAAPTTLVSALFADSDVAEIFSPKVSLLHYLTFEIALAEAACDVGIVTPDMARDAVAHMGGFRLDPKVLAEGVERDGMPIPAFVRMLKAHVPEDARAAVHPGSTSQDVMDSALALQLRAVSDVMETRLAGITAQISALEDAFGARSLMGRTRMQAALPITVGARLATWRRPLVGHLAALPALRDAVEVVQCGGPVGLRSTGGDALADALADRLGLRRRGAAWHSERGGLVEYGQFLARIVGSLGKIAQDVALMAQQGVGEVRLKGGGRSSAMAHKQNPVPAEIVMALARHVATLSGGLAQAMVHEQERSGAAWALEWLTLPQMAECTGAALRHTAGMLGRIEDMGS